MSARLSFLNHGHGHGFEAEGSFAAVVLAGTYGWGGLDLPHLPPRPLAEVVLEPVISYPLQWLRSGGASRAVVCANGSSSLLRARLGTTHQGVDLDYTADLVPRGPAGCVRDAAALIAGDPIVVVESTVIPTIRLGELLHAHRDGGAALTVVATPSGDRNQPTPAGIYVLNRNTLDQIAAAGYQDIKEGVIPQLARAGKRVVPFAASEPCPRIADLDSVLHVNQWMVDRLVAGNCTLGMSRTLIKRGDQLIHPTAVVHPSALLIGPVVIGRGAEVAPGATVVGPAVIGANTFVAPRALISRSIVGPDSYVGDQAMVHECVIAAGSFIEQTSQLHHTAPARSRPRRRSLLRPGRDAARPDPQGAGPSKPATVLPIRAARPLQVAAGRDALPNEEVVGA